MQDQKTWGNKKGMKERINKKKEMKAQNDGKKPKKKALALALNQNGFY